MKQSAYLPLETRTGTEKLAEALLLRGFSVAVKDDFIFLKNGSVQDYNELKSFLNELNIPVFRNGEQFQLLINHFPLSMMKKIVEFPGRDHAIHMEGYHFKWRSFVNRRYGIRTNTIELCPYTAIMVKALNEAGIVTLSGCNGHGHHSPNFKLSGIYQGIWFSIMQKQYLTDVSLHYKWEVQFSRGASNAVILAKKANDEGWEMKKVLSDCYQMAEVLTEHAKEIREWKSRCFKRNMKQKAETIRETGDFSQLYDWMKNLAESHKLSLVKVAGGKRA